MLPALAHEEQLHSLLLSGYWCKINDCQVRDCLLPSAAAPTAHLASAAAPTRALALFGKSHPRTCLIWQAFLNAMGPHLEIMRFMSPGALTAAPAGGSYEVRGDVMVHPTATIGAGCVIGPRVVVGPGCVVGDGVRLEDTALLEGATIRSHALVKGTLVGWRCTIGMWAFCEGSVLGEEVSVGEGLLVRGATVLPHKDLVENIRTPQIVI